MTTRSEDHAGRCRSSRGRPGRPAFALVAALAVLALAAAPASARPDARDMDCEEVQDLVEDSGQVVITTGQFTYQRFVAHGGYCDFFEIVRPEYIETGDTDVCPVNYICQPRIEVFGR